MEIQGERDEVAEKARLGFAGELSEVTGQDGPAYIGGKVFFPFPETAMKTE